MTHFSSQHTASTRSRNTLLHRKQSGFSLIEVVVSSAIAASVVGSLFAIAFMTIRLSVQGQDRLIGSELARDGLEVVRQLRDINYASGLCNPNGNGNAARYCTQWYDGIITPFNSTTPYLTPPNSVPVALSIGEDPTAGFSAIRADLSAQACSDYFLRDVDPASSTAGEIYPSPGNLPIPLKYQKQEVFCRRIVVEPVKLPSAPNNEDTTVTLNALRIRVQVAWQGYGRYSFRTLGGLSNANQCPTGPSTEWCTEETSIMTNWRSTRI